MLQVCVHCLKGAPYLIDTSDSGSDLIVSISDTGNTTTSCPAIEKMNGVSGHCSREHDKLASLERCFTYCLVSFLQGLDYIVLNLEYWQGGLLWASKKDPKKTCDSCNEGEPDAEQ